MELSASLSVLPIHIDPGLKLTAASASGVQITWQETQNQITSLIFPSAVVGQIDLHLEFKKGLALDEVGFYSCTYKGDVMAATHFKPNFARCAFPCFDEPALRAVFSLKLAVQPVEYMAISNMPLLEREERTNTFRFQDTPPMSTYLLHWSISKHMSATLVSKNQVPISIYNRKVKHSMQYLKLAQEACDYCVEYFQQAYPLPKLDIVAIYSTHYSGMRGRASESWGIVAVLGRHIEHRDNDIAAALSRNSRTICHEIAHMWVGNLVTITWWTSFWLSESLARFLEHKILHALRPEFRIWHKFQQEIIQPALEIDGSDKSHELEIECQDPEQLDSIYDTLAYGKGTAVICMLEELIGADNFRRGISDLIATNEYRSIDSAQFWNFMTSYSQYSDLGEVFLPWVYGTGFPLLMVSKTGNGSIFIEQRRFVNSLQAQNSEELWFLPLTYISDQDEGTQKILFKEKTLELTLGSELRWFACNLNRVCFIRVKYSDELLLAITEPVKKQLLSAIDIFAILDDHFLFYQSGSIKYTTLKELLLASAWCKELILCEKRLEIVRYFWRYLGGRYLFKSEVQTLARSLFESCLDPPTDCIDRDSILGLGLRVLVRICDDEDTKMSVSSTFLSKPSTLSPELYQVYAELFFLCNSLERVLEVARADLKLQYTAAQSGSEEVLRHYFGQFIAGRLHGLTFKHMDTFSMLKVMLQLLVEYSEIPEKWTQVKDSSFLNACVDALSRCMTSIYARAELDELLESIQALDCVLRVKHEKWLGVLVNSKEKLIRTYNIHQRTIDPMQAEILKHISP